MKTRKYFRDLYSFSGFRARATLRPHPEDSGGYIVTLERRQKKRSVPDAAKGYPVLEIDAHIGYETLMLEQPAFTLNSSTDGFPVRTVKP
jgi:hypothetical protein